MSVVRVLVRILGWRIHSCPCLTEHVQTFGCRVNLAEYWSTGFRTFRSGASVFLVCRGGRFANVRPGGDSAGADFCVRGHHDLARAAHASRPIAALVTAPSLKDYPSAM